MPSLQRYCYTGPIDHTAPIDKSRLAGKSVIVTGGANGMGEEFVRQYKAAGSFVTFGDVNEERGRRMEAELNTNGKCVHYVKCDVRDWDQQVNMFEAAKQHSPSNSCDIVIANAGISRSSIDSLWKLDDPNGPASKPNLNIVDVNVNGTLYTFKLAVHYFRKQPDTGDRDRCFIMTGSMTTWIDSPGNWEYTCTKYALRGLMRTVRRSSWQQGIRINYVAPCYIKSAIRTPEYEQFLIKKGVEFAYPLDVANCMMHISTDRQLNGHSLMIVPRSVAKEGFMDAGLDDFTEEGYLKSTQEMQLHIIEDQWTDDDPVRVYKN